MSHANPLAVRSTAHSQLIASTSYLVTIFLRVVSSSGRKDRSIRVLVHTQHVVGLSESHFSVTSTPRWRLLLPSFYVLGLTCELHFCWSLSCALKPNCRGVVPKTPDPCNPPADRRLVTLLVTLQSASVIIHRPARFLLQDDTTTSNAYTITGKWGRRVTQHKQAHRHTALQSSSIPNGECSLTERSSGVQSSYTNQTTL